MNKEQNKGEVWKSEVIDKLILEKGVEQVCSLNVSDFLNQVQ